MTTGRERYNRFNREEAALASGMEASVLVHYAGLGLILPSDEGYSEDDLAELRRVRRLHEELELDHTAIEIVLRMRQRIQVLQAEVHRLELALRAMSGPSASPALLGRLGQAPSASRGSHPEGPGHSPQGEWDWVDAEWDDL